jgi:hypothetical protein
MTKEEISKSIKFFREKIQSPFSVNYNEHCFNVDLEGWGIFRVDYLEKTIYYPDVIRYINGEPRTFCFEWSKIKPTSTFNSLNKKSFTTDNEILVLLDNLYEEAKKAKKIELEHQVRRDFK